MQPRVVLQLVEITASIGPPQNSRPKANAPLPKPEASPPSIRTLSPGGRSARGEASEFVPAALCRRYRAGQFRRTCRLARTVRSSGYVRQADRVHGSLEGVVDRGIPIAEAEAALRSPNERDRPAARSARDRHADLRSSPVRIAQLPCRPPVPRAVASARQRPVPELHPKPDAEPGGRSCDDAGSAAEVDTFRQDVRPGPEAADVARRPGVSQASNRRRSRSPAGIPPDETLAESAKL